jgi:FtsZ-binding cell division protein ZapB
MQIANPIYDSVFKYLMDDRGIASKLISLIIGQEVETLDLRPTEYRAQLEQHPTTVYRLDFCATIRLADGSRRQVLIEIQKAKYSTDIMRFRKYLGEQYANGENTHLENGERTPTPIISIYFLGHSLEKAQAPVIQVRRQYRDATTGEVLTEREPFIEGLTHDSYIIQIPHLRAHRRNTLEQVLAIFDQSAASGDKHLLTINEADFPEPYADIIRRLLKATAEPQTRKDMDVEDEIVTHLDSLVRKIQERDEALQQKNEALQQKNEALQQKESALQQKDAALQKALALLINAGVSETVARQQLGLR